MAMRPKLKVYRTPIGFHDAHVAAPSQKAALAAWGSDHDLFARRAAEIVTDAALMDEPLAKPGMVIKRLRGTAAEQIAALPADAKPKTLGSPTKHPSPPKPVTQAKPKPKPRPSRNALDAAEAALAKAEALHGEHADELARQEADLVRQRRVLEREHAVERERLDHASDKADAAYTAAIEKWRR